MDWALLWTCCLALLPVLRCALPPPCDSEIYCMGEILRQVQLARLFDDDKHFVDMKLKEPPERVLQSFWNLTSRVPGGNLPASQLRKFLEDFFEEPGTEFEPWTPADWHSKPRFLSKIADGRLRRWAKELHQLWKSLGRKVRPDVRVHPELYSLIYTPNPLIVPGGRFRELYYWDSYWVINGLLLSEMQDTARGMIENFLHLVDKYGFVPNGGRVYFERRSQPPFLTLMVESYYRASQDKAFLRTALPILEKEYAFWMQNRSVVLEAAGSRHTLNRYSVEVGQPRPESYTDDLDLAQGLTPEARDRLWMELKAGAESGWDFSSRWFINGSGALRDTHTSAILPADLNALLCRIERTLATFYRALGNSTAARKYDIALERRVKAVRALLWNEERGAWFDYNLLTNASHLAFFPSNMAPLWAQCYSEPSAGERALRYLQSSPASRFPSGLPTSLTDSGQQWDLPNAWPPLQHMVIEGLTRLTSESAEQTAFDLAQRWIRTNWEAYGKHKAMFEKYDVLGDGTPGGGGEYEVQLGFGWTNGVALQLLDRFGDRLSSGGAQALSSGLGVGLLCAALRFLL
ncbi:trehalase [Lepisosteus oculatus]|uniref:Trehalase n=1 Tax=Lepisosteus oculatus TaxID=7918 RepID=W5LXH3_LEPOC|nr:PREDICTED: trehalase [Lepisosteus oculatus]